MRSYQTHESWSGGLKKRAQIEARPSLPTAKKLEATRRSSRTGLRRRLLWRGHRCLIGTGSERCWRLSRSLQVWQHGERGPGDSTGNTTRGGRRPRHLTTEGRSTAQSRGLGSLRQNFLQIDRHSPSSTEAGLRTGRTMTIDLQKILTKRAQSPGLGSASPFSSEVPRSPSASGGVSGGVSGSPLTMLPHLQAPGQSPAALAPRPNQAPVSPPQQSPPQARPAAPSGGFQLFGGGQGGSGFDLSSFLQTAGPGLMGLIAPHLGRIGGLPAVMGLWNLLGGRQGQDMQTIFGGPGGVGSTTNTQDPSQYYPAVSTQPGQQPGTSPSPPPASPPASGQPGQSPGSTSLPQPPSPSASSSSPSLADGGAESVPQPGAPYSPAAQTAMTGLNAAGWGAALGPTALSGASAGLRATGRT